MRKRNTTTGLWLLLAVAALWLAGSRHHRLLELRQEYHLDPPEALEHSPPLIAFTTVAMGGFRGILVDFLWIRLSQLQQEGRYFELVQLADWITKLEPRSSAIWAFQAWNLSYNISVMMSDYEDRWRWVRHGIELLRDEGLRYNPANAQLHYELGYIFQHKMGADSDRGHWLYKREWFLKMHHVLNGPRPDYDTLRELPPTREQLRAREDVDELVREIRSLGFEPFRSRWLRAEERPEPLDQLLQTHPAATLLLSWLRARELRDQFRLDPDFMEELEALHGPLDWRVPETHALYWAERGLPYADQQQAVMLQRMIFQSLMVLFQRGRIIVEGELVINLPDLQRFDTADAAYRRFMRTDPDIADYRRAYEFFLKDAIVLFYNYQQRERALEIFERLRETSPEIPADMPFSLMIDQLIEDVAVYGRARHSVMGIVDGLLQRSVRMRIAGRVEDAEAMVLLARRYWDGFMAEREEGEFRERTGLPPFEVMHRLARDYVRREREALQE